ncbi:MAG: DUF2442 domain-containing protein [Ginsengibacter sp.]
MHSNLYKIISFHIADNYKIEFTFNDNTSKTIDFSPILYGEIYGPLKDADFFKSATLDKEIHTIVWPNGADFEPSLLYNWEDNIDEISSRAKSWVWQQA